MTRTAFLLLFFCLPSLIIAQRGNLFFKKGNRVIQTFWAGQEIAFQTADQNWHKGKITRCSKDSVYIRPYMVQYHLMGTDTVSWPVEGYHFRDISGLPRKGILISFINNRFQINRAAGHVHFFWIKGGALFRAGAAAYTGVMLINNLTDKKPDGREIRNGLITGASVFLFGFILKKLYSPVYKTGKKYRLEYRDLTAGSAGN